MATKPVDPIQAYLASIGATGFDPNGRPVGSTGGLVGLSPDQEKQLAAFRQPQQAPAAPANPLDKLNGLLGTNIGAPVMGQRMEQAVSQLPGGVQIAGGLAQQNDAQKAALFAQRMQETGGMPVPGAPDYEARARAAESIYNKIYSQQGQGNAFIPQPVTTYAPTGLREEVLWRGQNDGGSAAMGAGGVLTSYEGKNAAGGNSFMMRQGAQSSFMPQPVSRLSSLPANGPSEAAMAFLRTGEAPADPTMGRFQPPSSVAPVAQQTAPNALQTAQNQYQQAITPQPKQIPLPPGYEPDPAQPGAIRPMVGSKDYVERQQADAKNTKRTSNAAYAAKSTMGFIDDALASVSDKNTGISGAIRSKIPGDPALDLNETLETVMSDAAFSRLQQMREESPTGGALGNVANYELEALKRTRGSLSQKQSKEQLTKNLKKVRKHYERFYMANEGFDPDSQEDVVAFRAQFSTGGDGQATGEVSEVDSLVELYTKPQK